jgi:phage-related protein
MDETKPRIPLVWVASSLKDLRGFPGEVQRIVGYALAKAQEGGKHVDAKPLKGFCGAGVLEIVEDDRGGAYRAVYTVRFAEAIYVLHAFQKKSKRGIATPAADIEIVKKRLKDAEMDHKNRLRQGGGTS